jgi:hypothetical protein
MDHHLRKWTSNMLTGPREADTIEYVQPSSDLGRAQLTADDGSAGFIMLLEALDDVMVRLRALEANLTNSSGSGSVSRLEFEKLAHQVTKLKGAVKKVRK